MAGVPEPEAEVARKLVPFLMSDGLKLRHRDSCVIRVVNWFYGVA